MGSFEFYPPVAAPQHEISELIVVARRLWPSIQAHAYREQPGKSSDEALAFASEVWRSVAFGREDDSTVQREKLANKEHGSLSLGAFHHRFNRALKKERRRLQMMQHLPSSHDLERLRQATIQRRYAIWSNRSSSKRPFGTWMSGPERSGCSTVRIFVEGNRDATGPDRTPGQTSISLCNRKLRARLGGAT